MRSYHQQISDITCVAAFLAMAEREQLIVNSYTGNEAFEAFCRLLGVPAGKMWTLSRDNNVDSIIRNAGG